jgi:hypothetical protein
MCGWVAEIILGKSRLSSKGFCITVCYRRKSLTGNTQRRGTTMTISKMVRNAMHDERAKEEIITTAELVGAFVLPIFGGFILMVKVMG